MPRLRCSAGTVDLARRVEERLVADRDPPSLGVWKPAIDISVVDFPQPLGPSSVNSSPSATVEADVVERALVAELLDEALDVDLRHRAHLLSSRS